MLTRKEKWKEKRELIHKHNLQKEDIEITYDDLNVIESLSKDKIDREIEKVSLLKMLDKITEDGVPLWEEID